MSLRDVDLESALRRLAERRIEDAMREGKFDNLPGAGQPLELEPMPADEDARATWWAIKILRQNDVVPDEVKWRKRIDSLKGQLAETTSEPFVRLLVRQINDLVHRLNTLGTNALNLGVAPVSLEVELTKLHARAASSGLNDVTRLCPQHRCRLPNPADARYCRRCGQILS